MAREIKFSLVYRDMWQSSGKYVPRVDQLVEVAPAIWRGPERPRRTRLPPPILCVLPTIAIVFV